LLLTTLFIIIETSPVLVKTLSGKGSYDILLEQQETHGIYQGYLRDRQEKELQQAKIILEDYLKSITDFEQEIAKRKEKYLRLKEKSREKLNNRNIKNLREDIEKQDSQEILRFFEFCDRQIEVYLNIISNEMKNHPDAVNNISQKLLDLNLSDRLLNKLRNQDPEHLKKDLTKKKTNSRF